MESKNEPLRPYVLLSRGAIYICQSQKALTQASVYRVIGNFFSDAAAFDRNGTLWHVSEVLTPYPLNFIRKFLARTVFNPRIRIDVHWKVHRQFELDELKDMLRQIVDSDDDVITQFISAKELKSRIDKASTFENLLKKIRPHVLVE